jgi:enoyl-CoA hydratase/3-hydroxyacyl-CoA dehydrogenase
MAQVPVELPVQHEVVDGVLVVRIESPPVNALSRAVLDGLASALDRLGEPDVRALVLVGANRTFVAGADVSRLEKIAAGAPLDAPGAVRLPNLIARLEASAKPTLAAIDGFALGGGLELALGCHARLATARARVGLPELKLGLMPGAGGTQRLPRVCGVSAALDLMLTSRQASGTEALELGIVDEVVPEDELVDRARHRALELATSGTPRRTLERDDRLGPGDAAALGAAREQAAKRHRNVQFASHCIEAVAHGIEHGAASGLERERELFVELLSTEAARGLIHLFFAERAAAKVPGVTDAGLRPRAIERVVVIGGGTMGSGIATALLDADVEVQLVEVDARRSEAAAATIQKNFARSVDKGRSTRADADQRLSRLTSSTGLDAVGAADFVIEAASEDTALKRQLFAELGRRTPESTWLASNTSTIDVAELGRASGTPERVLGLHFFSPAHVMRLVEVIRSEATSAQALADAIGLVKRLKKTPVTVRSCPGFLVNRVFMPYSQLTGFLIDRGVDPYRIDRALVAFGMPMGPNRMSDLAGVDVGVAAGGILDRAYPDRSYRSSLRALLAEAGRLGEKSGAGHYRYEAGRAIEDPELAGFVARAREAAGSPASIAIDDDGIVRMLVFGIVNECCRAIEEGVVVRPSDIDVAATLGMGFPAYRGGPLKWADGHGARTVRDALAAWQAELGHAIFAPSAYLQSRAERGESLLTGAR